MASSAAVQASGVNVSILSTAKTLSAVVGRVVECKGPGTWCSEGFAWAIVKLAAEMIFYLLSGILKHVVGIGGVEVDLMMDPGAVLGVVVGAKGGLPIVNGLEGAEGVKVALNGLGHNDLIIVLVLNSDGNIVCEVMPIGFNVVFKHLVMDIDMGVGGGLGDIAGDGVGDAFKWKDGEGIGVTDHTVYDLCVREKAF
jgi:hypothetical protein